MGEGTNSGGFVMVDGNDFDSPQSHSQTLNRKLIDLEFILSGEDTNRTDSQPMSESNNPKGQAKNSAVPTQSQKRNKMIDFGHIKDFLADNQKDLYLFSDVFSGL